jgi:hypothetical protein
LSKKERKKTEFSSRFFVDQFEQYQQDWFKELMERKIEMIHHTIDNRGKLGVFRYTYNIYHNQNVYQVVATANQIELVRHLYTCVRKERDTITYQPVRKQQIAKDTFIMEEIKKLIQTEFQPV